MSTTVFNIPRELRDPFFFTDDKLKFNESQIKPCNPLFAFEILYYNGENVNPVPWMVQGAFAKDIIRDWKKEEDHIKALFRSRSKNVLESMRKSIGGFYLLLYWTNKQPVNLDNWQSTVERFSLKPVNVVERLTFIRDNPALYHSYIQLAQLFEEQHKQYAKYLALNQSANK
ncbi:hypothetical protein JI667_00995 [Bacillus sp. NTK074B]|uniref:YpoC family protein n=1 Tax=Bacillus sp. NTK074B TaxID=2802174 RepID=UPI001A90A2F6|nr:hypothetical protein [Bacillus sp. NTK074B]